MSVFYFLACTGESHIQLFFFAHWQHSGLVFVLCNISTVKLYTTVCGHFDIVETSWTLFIKHAHTLPCTHACSCAHTHSHACMRARLCAHTHAQTHTYTHKHTHTHSHTNTHVHTRDIIICIECWSQCTYINSSAYCEYRLHFDQTTSIMYWLLA